MKHNFYINYTFNMSCCNIYNCIIYYIKLYRFANNKMQCFNMFDNSKITEAFQPKVVHCDYTVGALRLRGWTIATFRLVHCNQVWGAFR